MKVTARPEFVSAARLDTRLPKKCLHLSEQGHPSLSAGSDAALAVVGHGHTVLAAFSSGLRKDLLDVLALVSGIENSSARAEEDLHRSFRVHR